MNNMPAQFLATYAAASNSGLSMPVINSAHSAYVLVANNYQSITGASSQSATKMSINDLTGGTTGQASDELNATSTVDATETNAKVTDDKTTKQKSVKTAKSAKPSNKKNVPTEKSKHSTKVSESAKKANSNNDTLMVETGIAVAAIAGLFLFLILKRGKKQDDDLD
ncbi:hypothetical protein FD35_GL001492 [Furfurilactobacillus rossiae DSM 15814]|uniref:Uncharacterized protein n=6 Tax=Furfurilactobacillus rossiae TaxID=231049 RepID=A0A0R1RH20_9LACO|nr:hypothetical protein FD35_GL001492 [Furfurilactobacillus rossiae DSM 15814]